MPRLEPIGPFRRLRRSNIVWCDRGPETDARGCFLAANGDTPGASVSRGLIRGLLGPLPLPLALPLFLLILAFGVLAFFDNRAGRPCYEAGLMKVQDDDERLSVPGATVAPPVGEHWGKCYEKWDRNIGFRWIPKTETRSAFAQVQSLDWNRELKRKPALQSEVGSEQLLDWAREWARISYGRGMPRETRVETETEGVAGCVRVSTSIEDREVSGHKGEVYVSTQRARICLDPATQTLVVMFVSERLRFDEEPAETLPAEADRWFGTLQFTSLQ